MIFKIENKWLSASVNTYGAELTELYSKVDGTRYICPEANQEWEGIAPVLFPNAGNVKDGANISGKNYPYHKHGFARDTEFKISEKSDSSITLSLASDKSSREYFPFEFVLSITYTLEEKKLTVSAKTENYDSRDMYYSIGFHPGFSCPVVKNERAEDYILAFPVKAEATRMELTGGLVSSFKPDFLGGVCELPIKEGMFDGGSYSMTGLNFSSVELRSLVSGRFIRVNFKDFPNLVLWAPRYKPFSTLCIEPWYARPDRCEGEPDLREKPDTITLLPGESRILSFSVEVN